MKMNESIHKNEEVTKQLQELKERLVQMKPKACGHLHEKKILEQERSGQMSKYISILGEAPFCSDEFRASNPACAHCLARGADTIVTDTYPHLKSEVAKYVQKGEEMGDSARLANPFAVEFRNAQNLGIVFSEEQIIALCRSAKDILHNHVPYLYRNDSRMYNVAVKLDACLSRLVENPSSRLLEESYFHALRNAIKELDIIANTDAKNDCYNRAEMQKRQELIIDLLENFQAFLLKSIDNQITKLKE